MNKILSYNSIIITIGVKTLRRLTPVLVSRYFGFHHNIKHFPQCHCTASSTLQHNATGLLTTSDKHEWNAWWLWPQSVQVQTREMIGNRMKMFPIMQNVQIRGKQQKTSEYKGNVLLYCSTTPVFHLHCVGYKSPVRLQVCTCTCIRARHRAAVQQYAGYYNRGAALCQGGVITVIRVAVGGSRVLLGERGDSLEKQVLSLTGVKLRKYINRLRWPTFRTPAHEKWLLINTATPQLLMMNPIQLNWPCLDV